MSINVIPILLLCTNSDLFLNSEAIEGEWPHRKRYIEMFGAVERAYAEVC